MNSTTAMKIILQTELPEICPDKISRVVDEVQRERKEGKAFLTEIDAIIDAYERLQRHSLNDAGAASSAVGYRL